MTSSFTQSGRPPARASFALRTASSAVSQPEVFGRRRTSSGRNDVMSSPGASKSIRRTATVTISVPEAATASRIVSKESYLPVPRRRREPNSRPAMVNVSRMGFLPRLAAALRLLAPPKLGLTLLGEGSHALFLVLRGEEHREEAKLGLHVGTRLAGQVEVRCLLGVREGEWALLRQLVGQLHRGGHQLGRVVDLVHEAPVVCLLGLDCASGEDDLLRKAEPDDARQALAPAPARDDPEIDLRLAKPCLPRGDADVAGEGELAAAAERIAVDRGDGRLGNGL